MANFDDSLATYSNIFNNVPEHVVVCLNLNNSNYNISSELMKKKCFNLDCSENWISSKRKIIDNKINDCQCELNN